MNTTRVRTKSMWRCDETRFHLRGRESRDVASIAAVSFIVSPCWIENIEIFKGTLLCRNSQSALWFPLTSLTSWWHQRCWNFPDLHWIRRECPNNCCCVWIAWSSYNTTLYTTGLYYEHRHDAVKFSNVSGTFTADGVQKWLFWQELMKESDGSPLHCTS